jgi:hypothetical protein
MIPLEGRLIRKVVDRLEALRLKAIDNVAAGVTVEKYREEVGYIRGLTEALKVVKSTETDWHN